MSNWSNRAVSASAAVQLIKSSHNVFVHGAAATPLTILDALAARSDLEEVKLYHLHLEGNLDFAAPGKEKCFRSISLFTSPGLRRPIKEGRADFVPVFLSDVPLLFKSGAVPLDVAILQLSPPDLHGYCSLGTSIDAARSACDNCRILVAEINQQMPRTHGTTLVHIDEIDAFCLSNRPLPEHPSKPETPVDAAIGETVAALIEDRSTLQVGIGAIPSAVLSRLTNKHDLGVHTEMFSDALIPLVECGAITNRYKKVMPGVIVTSFVSGSRPLFDFVNDNPLVQFQCCDFTNDTAVIRKNDMVVAVNSALQVDLTGQVCADSLGHSIYSGIGGQMDFIRGAAISREGKPIIALPSTAAEGTVSRITAELSAGAGVTTTRGHVHWVVTEYGAVNLHGKSLRERAELLISIAHPDFRKELKSAVNQIRHFC